MIRRDIKAAYAIMLLWIMLFVFIPCRTTAAQVAGVPVPKTDQSGTALKFDFPQMLVGVAEYDEGPTGTTVFYFPNGVKGAVDIRGGAPGELNAAIVQNGYESRMVRAVVFSGGSWYGLSSATGVANAIKKLKAAEGNFDFIAGVVGAIIFDVGGRRFSRVTPDDALGAAALQTAKPGWFPLGARGAGRFAMQGVYFHRGKGAEIYADWPHSGQGAAFRTVGPTKIGVFTVVNALGSIVGRDGRLVRCGRNTAGDNCPTIAERFKSFKPINPTASDLPAGPTPNTTITLVVTNQRLAFWALQRLAVQVHSSMSRAIQPFSTQEDGDILYAVTTDEVENASLTPLDVGVIASELAWDAILSSVPELPRPPVPLQSQQSADSLQRYVGTYLFPDGGELTVAERAGSLTAIFKGNGRIYFDAAKEYRLTPAENGLFVLGSAGRDVVKFDDSGTLSISLTVNPGPWSLRAIRKN